MDNENILANLVRIGTVSSVNAAKQTARVIYKDNDMVSGWLPVLQREPWMPSINDTVVVLYLPVFNGDGFILGAI
ncbi:MAG: hypothetical protein ABFD97_00350 [Syntrophobacter sp.]